LSIFVDEVGPNDAKVVVRDVSESWAAVAISKGVDARHVGL
jgi:hypothetical protein